MLKKIHCTTNWAKRALTLSTTLLSDFSTKNLVTRAQDSHLHVQCCEIIGSWGMAHRETEPGVKYDIYEYLVSVAVRLIVANCYTLLTLLHTVLMNATIYRLEPVCERVGAVLPAGSCRVGRPRRGRRNEERDQLALAAAVGPQSCHLLHRHHSHHHRWIPLSACLVGSEMCIRDRNCPLPRSQLTCI